MDGRMKFSNGLNFGIGWTDGWMDGRIHFLNELNLGIGWMDGWIYEWKHAERSIFFP